jgi:hypothetical protein
MIFTQHCIADLNWRPKMNALPTYTCAQKVCNGQLSCERNLHGMQAILAGEGMQKENKTYNSGDPLVVTHLTTNPPVSCLSTTEQTGSAGVSYSDATKVPKMTVFGSICQKAVC